MLHKQFIEVNALLDVVLGGAWKTTGYRGTKQRQRKNVLPLGECEKLHDTDLPNFIKNIYDDLKEGFYEVLWNKDQ